MSFRIRIDSLYQQARDRLYMGRNAPVADRAMQVNHATALASDALVAWDAGNYHDAAALAAEAALWRGEFAALAECIIQDQQSRIQDQQSRCRCGALLVTEHDRPRCIAACHAEGAQ